MTKEKKMERRFKTLQTSEIVEVVNALTLHLETMKAYCPSEEYEIDVVTDLLKEAREEADKKTRLQIIHNYETDTEH